MNFEAIPLYNKKIVRRATSEDFRNVKNKQKFKKCAWEIDSGVIKMYGTCLGKNVCLKKEIKEEMIECSKEYVCLTKGTFHFE